MRGLFVAVVAFAVTSQSLGVPTALLLAAGVAIVLTLEGLVPRQPTRAWATGADGEVETARFIDPLAKEGFVIFHDLRIPMSLANIDHVVIGPTGVFVIETKNIGGDLRIRNDEVTIAGRRIGVVEELRRELQAIWRVVGPVLEPLGLRPVGVICVHRARLPWFRRSVAGMAISTGRGLAALICHRPEVLSESDIAELRRRVSRALPTQDSPSDQDTASATA